MLKASNNANLYLFIRDFLFEIETSINNLLLSKNWLKYLIKKELIAGKESNSKLINDKGVSQLITYSLSYTFFDDIEDDFGERPNDVTIGFVLRISSSGEIIITRDIVSEFKDMEYSNIYYNKLTEELKNDILGMFQSYEDILINYFKVKERKVSY